MSFIIVCFQQAAKLFRAFRHVRRRITRPIGLATTAAVLKPAVGQGGLACFLVEVFEPFGGFVEEAVLGPPFTSQLFGNHLQPFGSPGFGLGPSGFQPFGALASAQAVPEPSTLTLLGVSLLALLLFSTRKA